MQSSEVQANMVKNRNKRCSVRRQVSDAYRVLIKGAESQDQLQREADVLSGMKAKLQELESEYVQLNQQFIAVQVQLREVVSEQRYKLVESINETRARSAPVRRPVALMDRASANDPGFLEKSLYAETGYRPLKKQA